MNVQLPDAASLERTVEVVASVEKIVMETPGVAHAVAIPGTSLVQNANSSNYPNMFVILKPFEERRAPEHSAEAILARLRGPPRGERSRRPRSSSSRLRRSAAWATRAGSG